MEKMNNLHLNNLTELIRKDPQESLAFLLILSKFLICGQIISLLRSLVFLTSKMMALVFKLGSAEPRPPLEGLQV